MDKNMIISDINTTINELASIKNDLGYQKGIGTEYCSGKLDETISRLKGLRSALYEI